MQKMLSEDVLKATIQRKEDLVSERRSLRSKLVAVNAELAEIIATEEMLKEVVEREREKRERHEELHKEALEEVANGRPENNGS